MLSINEADRPQNVNEVRLALLGKNAGASSPQVKTHKVRIVKDRSASTLFVFDQKLGADILELSLFVTPPGQYLGPKTKDVAPWSFGPHYFSLERTDFSDKVFRL